MTDPSEAQWTISKLHMRGAWINAQNLTSDPPYAPNNDVNFDSYELDFDPVVGDGIRIAGVPGGTDTYISVAELRAMDDDTSASQTKGIDGIADFYKLEQNYPNPFNPTTEIRTGGAGVWQRPVSEVLLGVADRTITGTPDSFVLLQNYPNPFNPVTTISYQIPSQSHVTLTVYDVLGREVATLVDEDETPGAKSLQFNASGLASGTYFYRLKAGPFMSVKRSLLVK